MNLAGRFDLWGSKRARHQFASLADALAFAQPLAQRLAGKRLVAVVRQGRFYGVTTRRHATHVQAWLGDIMVGYDDDPEGFSLIEVVIAMALMLVITLGLAQALLYGARGAAAISQNVIATNAATSRLQRQLWAPEVVVPGVTRTTARSTDGTACLYTFSVTSTIGQTFTADLSRPVPCP